MFHRLREPFGKAGLIVAIVALVASLAGGAYAAQSDSSGDATASKNKRNHKKGKRNKKKQKSLTVAQVRRIAKQEARKFANSNPGPAGPQGPAGAAGPKGDKGDNGSNGSNGANGTSANAVAYEGPECPDTEKGVEVTSAGPTAYVCDGKTGFTETLPPGETETGSWQMAAGEEGAAELSLAIPLAAPITAESNVVYIPGGETPPAECDDGAGTAPSPTNPEADPGFMCVFTATGEIEEAIILRSGVNTENFAYGVSTAGSILVGDGISGPYPGLAAGTFAVTG